MWLIFVREFVKVRYPAYKTFHSYSNYVFRQII